MLFSLLGIVAGFLVASWNYVPCAVWLRQWISSFAIAEIVAFLVLLGAVVMAVLRWLRGLCAKGVAAVGLGMFDRLLGAVFGLLRGLLGGAVVVTALVAFSPESRWVKSSDSGTLFPCRVAWVILGGAPGATGTDGGGCGSSATTVT